LDQRAKRDHHRVDARVGSAKKEVLKTAVGIPDARVTGRGAGGDRQLKKNIRRLSEGNTKGSHMGTEGRRGAETGSGEGESKARGVGETGGGVGTIAMTPQQGRGGEGKSV